MTEIYDCTLRDGTQGGEVNLTVRDKIELVQLLDDFGVDYIELGWPGSNAKDMQCFQKAAGLKLRNAQIVAFGSTRRKDMKPDDDPNLSAILESGARTATIFGKTIKDHIGKQLKATPEQNLGMIRDSIGFLRKKGLAVFYDAEHFFDGYADDSEYAIECLLTAAEAGAERLILCDTNGGFLPDEVLRIVDEVDQQLMKRNVSGTLGIHMHNDSGCAVANSVVASDHLTQFHVTVNGLGERAGNADLCQVVPNLMLKKDIKLPKVRLDQITNLSKQAYTLTNLRPSSAQPYVGRNAFAHKGGVHVDAMSKGASYEHIEPASVGNKRQIILSDLSGKASIVEIAKGMGLSVDKNSRGVSEMLAEVGRLENAGYDISSLPAEHFLLVERFLKEDRQFFKVRTWKVMCEQRNGEYSEAVITGTVDGKQREVVAPVDGGPVDALYKALQKMIATNHRGIWDISLINYKVMIAQDRGAESSVRVYIEFRNHTVWATVGVSTNIIEASLEAIEKGFRYFLCKSAR
ncbi:MAG: citramalate synthase [archaeon]